MFYLKFASWTNIDNTSTPPKAELLNWIWSFKLCHIITFMWLAIRGGISMKKMILMAKAHYVSRIRGLVHLFISYKHLRKIYRITSNNCPSPLQSSCNLINWLQFCKEISKFSI